MMVRQAHHERPAHPELVEGPLTLSLSKGVRRQLAAALLILAVLPSLAHGQAFDRNGMCVGDANGDDVVAVNELVTAVNNALEQCQLQPVVINFLGRVGEEPFACGQRYEGLGTAGADFIPADFRFYVHNIRLINEEGREVALRLEQDGLWQVEDVALLDFEDKTTPCGLGTVETNAAVRGMVPPGTYRGIRFVLGIPFHLNHGDSATAPSPLNLTAMFWSWQGGYKFLRIDEGRDLFRVHLGSSGCESPVPSRPPTSCARPNRGEVSLPDFDPATQAVVADLAALVADNDLEQNQPETPPGCMAGPEDADCEPVMRNLGVNFSNGLPDASRQRFFRVTPEG